MESSEDVVVKRSVLQKFSQPCYPTFHNDGTKQFIIAYDPASRQDNSVIAVAELVRDPDKGLMLYMVNIQNLVEQLKGGQVAVIQRPDQVEIFKQMILDYNRGFKDYEGIESVHIDGGSGGKPLPPYTVMYRKQRIELLESLKLYKLQRRNETNPHVNV